MSGYSTTDIRNLAIVGGAGTGKTTLVEALLLATGVVTKAGRIEDGNTVCDHDPIARELLHSVDSSVVHFRHGGAEITLIDTPGSPGFLGKTITALPAVETVAVVVDCGKGVDPVARRLMAIAESRDLPRMIIVNKIDHAATDPTELEMLVASIQEAFGGVCRPINLPAQNGSAVIDCYRGTEGTSDLGPVADFHTGITSARRAGRASRNCSMRWPISVRIRPRAIPAPSSMTRGANRSSGGRPPIRRCPL